MKNMKKEITAVLLSFLSILITYGQSDSTTYVKKGDRVPLFTCRTLDGKTIDISKLQGKIVLINFFATWCPPCNLELPVLQKNVWDKYKNNPDFFLLILGREQTEQVVKDYVEAKNFTMPFAPDPDRKIFKLFFSQNIPRNVIIGKDGKIIYLSTGYTEEEFKNMEKVLANYIGQ